MDRENVALEELKLVEVVIQKQEEIRFKIIGWCVALLTGLSIALLSEKIHLNGLEYAILATIVLIIFLWLDVIHRVAQDRAITRASEIEDMIRHQSTYDGPRISESLSKPNLIGDQYQAFKNVRVWSPYFALFVCILFLANAGQHVKISNKVDPADPTNSNVVLGGH